MKNHQPSECPFILHFPYAEAYNVEDVIDFITTARHPCIHPSTQQFSIHSFSQKWGSNNESQPSEAQPSVAETSLYADQTPLISMADASWYRQNVRPCPHCANDRSLTKAYLIQRLLQAVEEKKFELWSAYQGQVLIPPLNPYTQDPDARQRLPASHRSNPRPMYSIPEFWAAFGVIYRADLLTFCAGEKIAVQFEGQQSDVIEGQQSDVKSSHDEPNIERSSPKGQSNRICSRNEAANYKNLAAAFSVKAQESDNLNWFRNRCGNTKRYKAFRDALCALGQRGADPSTFKVLEIAAYLKDDQGLTIRQLRSGIGKVFPSLLDQFDQFFEIPEVD